MQATQKKPKPKLDWIVPILKSVWPFFAGLVFLYFFTRDPSLTEMGYSTSLYPLITNITTAIGKFLPASMAELTISASILFALTMGIKLIYDVRKAKKKERPAMLFSALCVSLAVLSYVFLGFVVLCAPNYHRQPFSFYSGHEVRAATTAELTELTTILGERTNELRQSVQEGGNGTFIITANNLYDVAKEGNRVMSGLGETYPVLSGITPPPKPVGFSFILSELNLSGFFFPYFTEPNFNTKIPAADIPFTMLHELAHAQGFMREDEANFIAYLACREWDNPDFAYSGNLMALRYCLSALNTEDPAAYETVWNTLSEPVKRDIQQVRDYWKDFDGSLATLSEVVNDTYLKANSQSLGTKSYGRVVDLLIAEYRTWPEGQN